MLILSFQKIYLGLSHLAGTLRVPIGAMRDSLASLGARTPGTSRAYFPALLVPFTGHAGPPGTTQAPPPSPTPS